MQPLFGAEHWFARDGVLQLQRAKALLRGIALEMEKEKEKEKEGRVFKGL